ncbi:MAG: hypothetical protein ABGZ53_22695 [Fuerstiella sp.]|jgi:aspartokinase-like uncharacterized kinase
MPADHKTLSILKLGGSLLSLPDVGDRLVSFVNQHQIENPVVVAGGGESADLVRNWAERFALSDSTAHDLALKAMALNGELLSHLDDRFTLVNNPWDHGDLSPPERVAVLHPLSAIASLEARLPHDQHLPKSWDVTSDSIAAWFAKCWNAERLYLLKSIDLPAELLHSQPDSDVTQQQRTSLANQLTQRGFVDQAFAEFATTIPSVAWCNLRCQVLELRMF